MRTIKNTMIIMVLSLLFSACAHQVIYLEGDLTGPPSHEETQSFFIMGVGQQTIVNASEVCGRSRKKLSRVEVRQTMSDALLSVVTLGIYTPRTVQVSCQAKY